MSVRSWILDATIARRWSRALRSNGFARFTTIVSVGSIALGTIALILSISILSGYEEKIEHVGLLFVSHVEIKPLLSETFIGSAALMYNIRSIEGVQSVDRIVQREALVRGKGSVDGAMIAGVTNDRFNSVLRPLLVQGTTPTELGAVIGEGLANSIRCTVGDTVIVYSSKSGKAQPTLFRIPVTGVIRSGMARYDNTVMAMPLTLLCEKLHADTSAASSLLVTCTTPNAIPSVATALRSAMGAGAYVSTYLETFQSMVAWIELQKKPIPIVLGLICTVAVFTVVSSMLIAIVEKTRSIAVLMALGMQPWRIMRIVLLRSLSIVTIGSAIGCAASAAVIAAQRTWHLITLDGAIYYVRELPMSFEVLPFLVIPAFALTLGVCVTIIPMVIAAKISLSRALRFA